MRYVFLAAFCAAVAVLAWKEYPDLKRYINIERM